MKFKQDIRALCEKLKPVIGDNADRLWNMYLAEDDKGKRELEQEIEIIAEKLLKKKPLENEQILLTPPSKENSSGNFLIGNVIYNRKKLQSLFLKESDFIRQVGIFAVTGEGKTNLAHLLALQLLKRKIPFLVIDWKRSWRNLLSLEDKYPELKDVQVFTIGRDILPFFWNPFRPPPGSDKQLWIGTISEALEKSHLSGPGVAYFLNKIFLKLMRGLGDEFYPNFYDGLKEIENSRVVQRELKWKQSAQRIFQSFTIGSASKVFNVRNPIKLEDLLDKPVILELDLELPKPLRIFLSEIILRWIHLFRLGQGETEALRHVLFLEEAHNLFAHSGFYTEVNSLENVYREIRAFGQGIISITQHPSLLPIYLLGNCHTQIYLGLQHEDDIKTARKALFLRYDQESYLNLLKVGEAVIKIKNRIDPCHVKIPLVPVIKGKVTDKWLMVNTLVNTPINTRGYLSNRPVGKKHAIKGYLTGDKNTKRKNGKDSKQALLNKMPQYRLLFDVFEFPFSPITKRYDRLKLNPRYGNEYKNQLIKEDCIKPKKIITSKGWLTLFELTQKAILILRDFGYMAKNTSEGIIHKFWKQQIAQYYKDRGYAVLVEEKINGRPDIIAKNEGKTIAVEIETGMSDFIGNINRALKADFDEIVCVATNRYVAEKIEKEFKDRKITDEKITITSGLSFDI